MKVLVFDARGKYALFRRSFTTTSSTSYAFPPRTALCGLIGAILGIKNERSSSSEHLRHFDSAHIAVRLLNPLKKVNMVINYIETKEANTGRTQIVVELIKSPAYRIYVHAPDLHEKLKHHLENKLCVFTPYLGQAQMIADFEFVGEYDLEEVETPVEVHTVLKQLEGMKIEPKNGSVMITERMTLNMDNERRPTSFATYWFEKNATPVKLLSYPEAIYRVKELGDVICWMD